MTQPVPPRQADPTAERSISLDVDAGVATITINRPRAGNALDIDAARRLWEATTKVDQSADVRCVVLTGAGRAFCAGGDVKGFSQAGDAAPTLLKESTVYLHAAISQLSRMAKPLITAVNGAAAGAGMGLALLGDIVLVADTAFFTTAYSAIGLSPDGGVSWLLPRLVGLRAAQEMILTSRKISASEALKRGMVSHIVPAADLAEQARGFADRLARLSPHALGEARSLLLSSYGASLEAHLELEARAISRMSGTPFARAQSAAFARSARSGEAKA